MTNKDFKTLLITALKSRNVYTSIKHNHEVVTRCPFCGDSEKNLRDGHLYIRINPDDNYPIVYNCFKCPANGILSPDDLDLLGIQKDIFKQYLSNLNKTSDKLPKGGNYSNAEIKFFDYKIPEIISHPEKVRYIENRLGKRLSHNTIMNMKMITSLKDFLIENKMETITCSPGMAKLVESKYVGFLSHNGAYILFRDITDSQDIRWYKYPITVESYGQSVLYSIKQEIDIFTDETITINLSEGVLDCLSIAYNINTDNTYHINMAVGGKFYTKAIKYFLGLGFVGRNIIINIYSDNDKTYDTSLEYYRKTLKKFTYLVKEINVFYNTLQKDVGYPSNQIKLVKYKI